MSASLPTYVGCSTTVKITYNGSVIDGHWNSFGSVQEAGEYLKQIVRVTPGTYGFLETKTSHWEEG